MFISIFFEIDVKKKFIIIIIPIFLILTFLGWVGTKAILNTQDKLDSTDSDFGSKISYYIPREFKIFLKKTIFIIPSLKREKLETIKDYKKKINFLNKETIEKNKIINKITLIDFNFTKNILLSDKFNNYKLKKFKSTLISSGIFPGGKSSGYLAEYQKKIILVTGQGNFLYFDKSDLKNNTFNAKSIKNNFYKFVDYEKFYFDNSYSIKDILLHKNKLYVSYTNQESLNCYNTAIVYSDIGLNTLNFKEYFISDQCVNIDNDYGEFNAHQAGGRMIPEKESIIFSHGDFRNRLLSQNDDSIFGKIILVNSKDYKVISKGHRNVQGLYLSNKNNFLLSTEHGPQGGDEINLNQNVGIGEIENYGWPISSYGEHYGGKKHLANGPKYEKAPLHKSHKEYGFIEPVKYFVPSIGISQIINISNLNPLFKNDFLIGSMGTDSKAGSRSIHHIRFNENSTDIVYHSIMPINERIRDMIYIKDINKVLIFLENSPGIGILEIVK